MPVKALRFVVGCAIGFLLWRYGTPFYGSLIAPAVALVLRPFAAVNLTPAKTVLEVTGAGIPPAHIPFSELTYNVILFLGLFATIRGLFRDKTLLRFVIASVALAITHVLATAADVMSVYATHAGAWSNAHFSGNAQDFWEAVDYIYRVAGMFGIAFAAWYLTIGEPQTASSRKRHRRSQAE